MRVNILMSTYNGETFLAEQIESIRRQTFTDWMRHDLSSKPTHKKMSGFALSMKMKPRTTVSSSLFITWSSMKKLIIIFLVTKMMFG